MPKLIYDDLVAHAIQRGLKPQPLKPGEHLIAGVAELHLDCSLTKGDPTSARIPFKPAWPRVVAWLMRRLKVEPEKSAPLLQKAFAGAEAMDQDDLGLLAVESCVASMIEAQPEAPRDGATRFAGQVKLASFTRSK